MTSFYFHWQHGIFGDSIWAMMACMLAFAHFTLISVTVYLHRFSAHRSLELHISLQQLFRLWLWLTTGMRTKTWTAIHRKHHVYCETEQDPHSPVILGMRTVLARGAELYMDADTAATRERFGRGTPNDWMERHVYRHANVGIALMLLIDLVLFGIAGITVWALQMLLIPVLAAGIINGLGHGLGYRNYELPNASTNILPWGILIAGEELHNNHHTFPNSAKLSVKPWEFDIGWLWIRVFEAMGLARVRSDKVSVTRVSGKNWVDLDTAWAALHDRFNILASYADRVIKPLVDMERKAATSELKPKLKRARKLLCKDISLLDEKKRQEMRRILSQHPRLKATVEMREALAELLKQRGRDRDALLLAFRAWCQRAEQSRIDALREFAGYLRSYSLKEAS